MPNDKWASASIEEKLEMLRRDVIRIQDAQNRLADQFREVTHPLANALAELAAASTHNLQSQAAGSSSSSENHQGDSNGDQSGDGGRP
jgi:hypothetical protein